jgi:hypothetical protein
MCAGKAGVVEEDLKIGQPACLQGAIRADISS